MQKKRKVLFLSSCVSGGGAGRSLLTILQHCPDNIEPWVVIPELAVVSKEFEKLANVVIEPAFLERIQKTPYSWIESIPYRPIKNILGGFVLGKAILEISKHIYSIKPDLIYCNHMLAEPLGVFLGWRHDIPVILHARNIHNSTFGRWFLMSWLQDPS